MKKWLIAVACILAISSLLVVSLLLQSSPSTLASIPKKVAQPTTQNSSQPTFPTISTPALQNATPSIVAPLPFQNTFTNTSTNPQQPSFRTIPSNNKHVGRTLQEAVGNATVYLAETQEPYGLLMINVLYRSFGITQFADSLQRYDQLLSQNPDNAPILRIFRRIADYKNELQPTDFSAVTAEVDKITVPALYSDKVRLPEDFQSKLNDAANSGGYLLTHTLLAIIWLHDNNCEQSIPDDFKTSVYQATAGLIDDNSVITDIELEAAAFLYAAGQGELVSDAFVEQVIAVQNYDGGWSPSSDVQDDSFWHASVLALMLLLNVEFITTSYMPMLASALANATVYFHPLTVYFIIVWLSTYVTMRKKLNLFYSNKFIAL